MYGRRFNDLIRKLTDKDAWSPKYIGNLWDGKYGRKMRTLAFKKDTEQYPQLLWAGVHDSKPRTSVLQRGRHILYVVITLKRRHGIARLSMHTELSKTYMDDHSRVAC